MALMLKITVQKPQATIGAIKTYRATDFVGREHIVSAETYARLKVKQEGFTLIEEVLEERAVPPECGYFDLFTTPEGAISPENAADALLAGNAELVTDVDEATQIIHGFAGRARFDAAELRRYHVVLDIAVWTACRRREEKAWELLGLDMLGVSSGSAFFTEKQVAELYGVSVDQIRAWEGQKLPAAIKHRDGSHYFKAAPILTQLRQAGPARSPKFPRRRASAAPRRASNNRRKPRPATEGGEKDQGRWIPKLRGSCINFRVRLTASPRRNA